MTSRHRKLGNVEVLSLRWLSFLSNSKSSILWLTVCLLFKDSKTAKFKLFFQNLTGQGYSPESAPAKVGQFLQFSQEPPARLFATAREYFSSFKLCVVPDLGNLRPCKWWQLKDILLMIQPIYFTLDLIIIKDPMVRICAVSIPCPPWRTWINK